MWRRAAPRPYPRARRSRETTPSSSAAPLSMLPPRRLPCVSQCEITAMMPAIAQPLVEGDPKSPVRVVMYEDLQCPDCAWLRAKLDERILPAYGTRVAFEHREFPLPKHNWARLAAIAARYFQSASLEAGAAFRRETLASLSQLTLEAFPTWVRSFAKRHGVDPDAAQMALEDPSLAAAVEADYQSGLARSVAKTPTVFVGAAEFIEW